MWSSWHDSDLVTDPEHAAVDDFGPQTAAVLERGPHAGPGELFEVRAGRRGLDRVERHLADPEGLTYQVMERYTLGHEIATRLLLAQYDTFFVHARDHLAFDECHLPVGAFASGIGSLVRRVAIAVQPDAFDRA